MHPSSTFDLVRRDHEQRLDAARTQRSRRRILAARRPSGGGASGRPPEPVRLFLTVPVPALVASAR
jgi:hypothetical protein